MYKHASLALFQPKQANRFTFPDALVPPPASLMMSSHPHLQISFQMPLDPQARPLLIAALPATLPPKRLCSSCQPRPSPLPNLLPHPAPSRQASDGPSAAFKQCWPSLSPAHSHLGPLQVAPPLLFPKNFLLFIPKVNPPRSGVSGQLVLCAPSALPSVPAHCSDAPSAVLGQGSLARD